MKSVRLWLCSLAIVAAAVCAGAARAQTTVRAISFIPKNDPVLTMAQAWVSEVNAKLGSQLRINYVGGPEVIGRFQQPEALRTGSDSAFHLSRFMIATTLLGQKNGRSTTYFTDSSQPRLSGPVTGQPNPSTTPEPSAV